MNPGGSRAPRVCNIGSGGRRQRLRLGLGAVALAVVATAAGLAIGVGPGWLIAVWPAFWLGALGLIQARDHV